MSVSNTRQHGFRSQGPIIVLRNNNKNYNKKKNNNNKKKEHDTATCSVKKTGMAYHEMQHTVAINNERSSIVIIAGPVTLVTSNKNVFNI